MEKSIAAAAFGVIEIINYIFGNDWLWGHVTEQEIGILFSALMPFIIWFVPNGLISRWRKSG